MFILFTNLFLARPFRLENTLECYNLRGGQGGSTEVFLKDIQKYPKLFEDFWKYCNYLKCFRKKKTFSDKIALNKVKRLNKFK